MPYTIQRMIEEDYVPKRERRLKELEVKLEDETITITRTELEKLITEKIMLERQLKYLEKILKIDIYDLD